VRLLLDAGADPSAAAEGGVTPLHAAAETGDAAVVAALLAGGADPAVADGEGARPLEAAAQGGFEGAVGALFPVTPRPAGADGEWSVAAVLAAGAEAAKAAGDGCGYGHDHHGHDHDYDHGHGPSASLPSPPLSPDAARAAAAARAGDEAFVSGDHAGAVGLYSTSLRHATDDARVWADRAGARLRLGGGDDFEAALADARTARTIEPANAKAWLREGIAASALEWWEDAAAAFFEAHRANPDLPGAAAGFQEAVARGRAAHQAEQQGT
jgi:tetratricopeptide (TPR) repeat protein